MRFRIPEIALGALLMLAATAIWIAISPKLSPQGIQVKPPNQSHNAIGGRNHSQHGEASIDPGTKEQDRDGGQKASEGSIFDIKLGEALLVLVTLMLWKATRDLVIGADESSRRQLRPYLDVSTRFMVNFRPDKKILFGFNQLNAGVTPAFKAVQYGAILMLPYPLPVDFPFPKPFEETRSKTTLMPRSPPIIGHIEAQHPISAAELVEALQAPPDGRRLYIFGQVSYRDAFKQNHWRRFAFCFKGFHPLIAPAMAGNWDIVEQVLASNSLEFEMAGQHNETDDEE